MCDRQAVLAVCPADVQMRPYEGSIWVEGFGDGYAFGDGMGGGGGIGVPTAWDVVGAAYARRMRDWGRSRANYYDGRFGHGGGGLSLCPFLHLPAVTRP
jgi:hypothetical protein